MAYHVGVDVGGTFTDLFAIDDRSGAVLTEKADSTADGVGGVLRALQLSGIAPAEVATLVFGSTAATNALVERHLAPVAFLATEGFTDTLEIRRLWREHLFGWQWDRPVSLVPHDLRFGIPGRIDWRGREIAPLDLAALDGIIARLRRRGIGTVAVSLLFSFVNPAHEHRVRDRFAEAAPEITVLLSSDVNPEIKEYERASTTVIAAALSPLVDRMLASLEERLAAAGVIARPQIIKSNGGIMSAAAARAKPLEMVRSGPAGGVASALRLSRELGLPNLITVDIGGTTADVAVVTAGEAGFTRQAELEWDIPIRVPMADVRSVGAGGGSIALLDAAGRLRVGPESAGANPGPACYGRGGTAATVTDAAVVAGHLDPARFLGGRMAIDARAAEAAVRDGVATPLGLSVQEAASGILRLAAVRMGQLIGEMTVQVGLDPRDYVLVGFGGAGPLFLGALLDEVEAESAIVPRHPSVWSAFGGLFADVAHDYARSHIAMLDAIDPRTLDRLAQDLTELAAADLRRDGLAPGDATLGFALDMRYAGQSHEITVPLAGGPPFGRNALKATAAAFAVLHERHYAHQREDPCQLVTMRLAARLPRRLALPPVALPEKPAKPIGIRPLWFHGRDEALDAQVWSRDSLAAGQRIAGPALVIEPQAHIILPPDQTLDVGAAGALILRRAR